MTCKICLQEGRRYVLRNGGITSPLRAQHSNHVYPFTDGRYSWTAHGLYYDELSSEHPCDIIKLYTGDKEKPTPIKQAIDTMKEAADLIHNNHLSEAEALLRRVYMELTD